MTPVRCLSFSLSVSLLSSFKRCAQKRKRRRRKEITSHTNTRNKFSKVLLASHIHSQKYCFVQCKVFYISINGQYKRRVLQRQFVLSLFKLSQKFVFNLLYSSRFIPSNHLSLFSIRIMLVHLHDRTRQRKGEREETQKY